MEIPADGIVLSASELTADESAMTGETGNNKGEKRDQINLNIFFLFLMLKIL